MDVKEGLSLVAKLVLDSMGETKENSINTQLGMSLFNLAKKEIAQKDKKSPEIISPEVDKKIRELKSVEGIGGISWIDHYSWNLLPPLLKNQFIQLLDPLIIWQGVFVLKFKLDSVETMLWSKLSTDFHIYELRDLNSFQLCIMGTERSYYDTLSPLEFNKRKSRFEAQCVRAFGNTPEGLIIKVKERHNAQDNN